MKYTKFAGGFVFVIWVASRLVAVALTFGNTGTLFHVYYLPFVEFFVRNPSADPWEQWILDSGAPEAFPYGWPLLLVIAALLIVTGSILDPWIGFVLLMLVVDLFTFVGIKNANGRPNVESNFPEWLYVLSPIVLVGSFGLGSLDLIVSLLLVLGVQMAIRRKVFWAGVLFGAAAGVKIMLFVAFPIFVLYLIKSSFSKYSPWIFSAGFTSVFLLSLTPIIYSTSFRDSLLATGDAIRPLTWGLATNTGTLPALPFIAAVFLFFLLSLRRMNSDLLIVAIAIPLLVLAVLPGAPLAWVLWVIPILGYASRKAEVGFKVVIFAVANLGVVRFALASTDFASNNHFRFDFLDGVILASGLATAIIIWRQGYVSSDLVRLRSRPALVLIGGDSGVGKDTLANGVISAFGATSCTHISGDDYHRWERGSPNWMYFTHLDPRANLLDQFHDDILSLSDGASIQKSHYSHTTGRIMSSRKVRARDLLIASGLHALSNLNLIQRADVSVFLEMDPELRKELKVLRDTAERGHEKEKVLDSLRLRVRDSENYIAPQRDNADIVFTTSYLDVNTPRSHKRLVVRIETPPKVQYLKLVERLKVLTNLSSQIISSTRSRYTIEVSGNPYPGELQLVFNDIEPRVSRIIGAEIQWLSGARGIIQLITLIELSMNLRSKRLTL